MRIKSRRYCPRCSMWVPFQSPESCGLHKCTCGRKFHSLTVLIDHLKNLHFFDIQQISTFLHENPKSKLGNFQITKEGGTKRGWFSSSFCSSCANYLSDTKDRLRYCKNIKCSSGGDCVFTAHSKNQLKLHLTEVHAKIPIEIADERFYRKWNDSLWSRKDYFLCEVCEGLVLYKSGERKSKECCYKYKCPISDCGYNKKERYHHDVEHLLGHLSKFHKYWKCEKCNKYLPPESEKECKAIYCVKCMIYHHNDLVKECKITMNISELEPTLQI